MQNHVLSNQRNNLFFLGKRNTIGTNVNKVLNEGDLILSICVFMNVIPQIWMASERTGGGDLLMVCVCVFIAMSRYLESYWVRYLKIHICRARIWSISYLWYSLLGGPSAFSQRWGSIFSANHQATSRREKI